MVALIAVAAITTNALADDASDAASRAQTARQMAHHSGGDPRALAQVIQLTRGLPATDAATALDELAAAHQRAGQLTLAADARRTLVAEFPQEALAASSMLWLVRLYASSEISHASRQADPGKQALALQLASTNADAGKTTTNSAAANGAGAAAYGLHLAGEATRANPALDDDPALRFQRYVAARRAGDEKGANKFLAPLNRPDAIEPWAACARAELWLAQSASRDVRSAELVEGPAPGDAPKPTLLCPRAVARPRLNGQLDKPLWKKVSGTFFGGRPHGVEVRLAYDGEFLYVAIRCKKLPSVRYEADSRPRTRDADLSDSDRVRLLVDLDRDYATWFELTIDSRGWTADRCGDDAAWNPEWYVAASEDRFSGPGAADHWTIEVAIPFTSLADNPPPPGAAWAIAIDRLAPNAAAPAAAPQDFRLLLFQ